MVLVVRLRGSDGVRTSANTFRFRKTKRYKVERERESERASELKRKAEDDLT